ncbi:MAG: valine--tRNA ligase [Deltaproteobacteria bacterium]|nr:valine--tRNA ligase [Deltaproteobacteria bacterium]
MNPTENEGPTFPKRFDFREAETRIYARWIENNAFQSAYKPDGTIVDEARAQKPPFVVVIPPPNITGRLHMGHALNNTLQDVLVRAKRMDGFDALWIPGTDHAGIATQTIVKKQLDAQGIDYRTLGREEVIKRIWAWRNEYGDAILNQLRRMGCSCDWSRTRFTMDEGMSHAVRLAFSKLYDQGLIYRGKRIVNWCPVDQTALADDEVEKEDEKGKLYFIRYPFVDNPSEHLVVATTRPETLFGDTAVAIHPEHPELARHIGRQVLVPLQERVVPIIGDEHADPEKGTGCVKITPAHDPNDFEVGLRHNLEAITVMNEDASMNDIVPAKYRGMDRYVCRKEALADLEAQGLLEKTIDHVLAMGRSYRSRVPIEFRLSDQWFVKMGPLAAKALEASGYRRSGDEWTRTETPEIRLHPDRFEKVYFHWLSNIRDWCISRQIWWGHRIPAWFHRETGELIVSAETPERVAASPDEWTQDPDVLDTWFSSWLWPMSVFGWPERTPDFERYYPTSVLSTAKDILFFWVARMNFAGLHFAEKLPYQNVYLHSTIADDRGMTMSKSKGNGIDPLTLIDGATVDDLKRPVFEARPSNMKELIKRIEKNWAEGFEAVGADAMRWTLVFCITEGDNIRLSLDRFTEGRNFVTKLWNGAGRVITALDAEISSGRSSTAGDPIAPPTDEDEWLLARLDSTIRAVRSALDVFDFGGMAKALYRFVWDDFCAWALELSKTRLSSDDLAVRRGALAVMGTVLTDTLRLLHPVIPFVTEELFQRATIPMTKLGLWLDAPPESALLVRDRFPEPRRDPNPEIEGRFEILQRFVLAVRQLRAASNIPDSTRLSVAVKTIDPQARRMLEQAKAPVAFLARLDSVEFVEARSKGMAAKFDVAFELYLDLARYVDLTDEVARLQKELDKTEKELASAEATLANPNFVSRAPEDKVEAARARQTELEEKLTKLRTTFAEMSSLLSA